MGRTAQVARAVMLNTLAIAAGAMGGAYLATAPDRAWTPSSASWQAIFLSAGVLFSGVALFAPQIFGRFDRLLSESRSLGVQMYLTLSGHLRERRLDLIVWLVAGTLAAAIDIVAANVLTSDGVSAQAFLLSIEAGAAAAVAILLCGVRSVSAYLRLGEFCRELVRLDVQHARPAESSRLP